MTHVNTLRVGSTGSGKTMAAAYDIVHATNAAHVVLDPTNGSLARTILTHVDEKRVIYDRLSNNEHAPGYALLERSTNKNPHLREAEDARRKEVFEEILLRRRQKESMAGAPLMEEYVRLAMDLHFAQSEPSPLARLPFAFMPGTDEFESLIRNCTAPEITYRFRQLEKLSPRALRAEIGSVLRFLNGCFRSKNVVRRSQSTFDRSQFLQDYGIHILERGDDMADDAMRVIFGAVIALTIEHAMKRPKPFPPIFIHVDECTTERLVGSQESLGAAATRKYGVFWDFLDQQLDLQGHADSLLQNCRRHEWFCCARYDLARKAAIDIAAGLSLSEDETRAEKIEQLTKQVMNARPGEVWVRDSLGSRKEYVPLLQHPLPDWPGLRERHLQEKIRWIYSRPEYRNPDDPSSESGSAPETPPAPKSPKSFSPAARLKVLAKKQAATSSRNENEKPSESAE